MQPFSILALSIRFLTIGFTLLPGADACSETSQLFLAVAAAVCPWSASAFIQVDRRRLPGSLADMKKKALPNPYGSGRESQLRFASLPRQSDVAPAATLFPGSNRSLQNNGQLGRVTRLLPLMSVQCNTGMVEVSRDVIMSDSEPAMHTRSVADGPAGEKAEENGARKSQTFRLAYTVFRPMSLSSRKAAPLVVLHGGPSVPSNYLHPIANAIPYRSVICYDQLGCGASDEPRQIELYSIANAVQDLKAVLKKLGVRRYHLYGQSFGGILAYEFLKEERKSSTASSNEDEGCLSLILSSSPTNVSQVEAEAARLLDDVKSSHGIVDDDDSDNDSDDSELAEIRAKSAAKLAEWFRLEHQCRTPTMPVPLQDAYARAGTTWRGTKAIPEYAASVDEEDLGTESRFRMPSAMVLRGEHDFCTAPCVEGWKDLLTQLGSRSVRYKTLDGCSHHGLLEQPSVYGQIIDDFLCEYD